MNYYNTLLLFVKENRQKNRPQYYLRPIGHLLVELIKDLRLPYLLYVILQCW